jgi:glycosyltransferase involved in cell wall biosynthesis
MGTSARPLRVLMSIDAVGGVWRYAMDLAVSLKSRGTHIVFVGLGPEPSGMQADEANTIGKLIWLDAPLDWTARDEEAVALLPKLLSRLSVREQVDLIHLNLPSQAVSLKVSVPVLVVSHSCVVTWFAVVRGQQIDAAWRWQERLNRLGFERADCVLAPSESHAHLLKTVYPGMKDIDIVYNGSGTQSSNAPKENFAFAAGRWWDDGKNGAVLDAAAAATKWPIVAAGANAGPNGQNLELKNVLYRGEMSHAEVTSLMERAAIAISPSVYEPFGLVPLEAARHRAALVLADIPTYRELWNGAALFADTRDPAAFAAHINRLVGEPALRKDLAAKALERSRLFTLEAQAAAMSDIYRGLLARSHIHSAA